MTRHGLRALPSTVGGGAIAALSTILAAPVQGRALVVCPQTAGYTDCQFRGDAGIQQAIDASSDGDTILIKAGHYAPVQTRDTPYKDIVVRAYLTLDQKKDLTLRGEPGTVLDGRLQLPATAIAINRSKVSLSNLRLVGFRYAVEEDNIYDGHGIFAIDSELRLDHVSMTRLAKMALTGRGDSRLEVSFLEVLEGHMGVWLNETSRLRLSDSVFRNNDSCGLGAYGDSSAEVINTLFEGNRDDGVYAEQHGVIQLSRSFVINNQPVGVHAIDDGRITITDTALIANAVQTSVLDGAYRLVDRFQGPDGGYDYVSVDHTAQSVFVGRESGVMKIDLARHKVIPDFVKGEDVAAVLLIPGSSLMLSTNGRSNTATLFDRRTGKVKSRVPTGKGPDSAAYDPATKLAFVMSSESGDVTLIDPIKAVGVGSIALEGHPEAAVADGRGHLFVNVEDRDEIADVDIGARKVVGRYKLPNCHEPTGIAFDGLSGTLVSACRNKVAKLIEAGTGTDRGTLQVGEGADGAIFDVRRRLVYIPSNEGILSIFTLAEDGEVQTLQEVKTERYARTAAVDEETGRLYLPADQRTQDTGQQMQQVPGTFHVLVVAPN